METHEIPFYAERKAALIEEISAAFDGVSREGGVSLSEATVIDDYGGKQERAAARARDSETRWQDVPDEDLGRYWDLHFFDPIGFRYYLPCFLLAYLRYVEIDAEDTGGPYVLDGVFNGNNFSNLDCQLAAGYPKGEVEEFYLSKFELLTPEQSRAVAHFLQLEAERRDAWDLEAEQFQVESEIDEEFEEWKANNVRKETEKRASMSPQEIEERERELEQRRAQHNSPDNDARYALEKYWGRFL